MFSKPDDYNGCAYLLICMIIICEKKYFFNIKLFFYYNTCNKEINTYVLSAVI